LSSIAELVTKRLEREAILDVTVFVVARLRDEEPL